LLRQICREESDACKEFFASLDLLSIISAAEAIRKSKRIFICAHDISHVLAEFLAARLKLLYFEPKMIDLNNLNDTQEKLEMLTSDDIVIFIAFPKYYYPLGSIAKNAFSRGAQILTITDSVSSPTVQYSKYLLLCHTSTRVFYNSLTLPMALANLLLSYLVIDLGPDYRSRDLSNALSPENVPASEPKKTE
ncbi:MAG: SIS domain-containing protein, partial [Clostridium sp.]|nr:SIS domain-containing protein [Clostridium sp.]